MSFLVILGIIFFLAIGGGIVYRFRARLGEFLPIKKSNDYSLMLGVLPPIRLMLNDASPARWSRRDQFDRYEQTLRKAGFIHAAYLESDQGEVNIQLSLWNHPKAGLMCAMMESAKESGKPKKQSANEALFSVELIVKFSDGSTLTTTTRQEPGRLPRPIQHAIFYCAKDDLHALFAELKSRIPKNKKVQPVKDVKSAYIAQTEQYSEWLWREERLRSSQMQAVAQALKVKLTDELIEQLLELAGYELSERYTQRILNQFESHSSMDVATWEEYRERLVVVHELMRPSEVVHCVYELVSQVKGQFEEELDAFSDLRSTEEPVQAFHHFLDKASAGSETKRLAKVDKPINAEIYLAI